MPAPLAPAAILGIGWLGALIAGLVGGIVQFLLKLFTKRVLILGTIITLLVTTTTLFLSAVEALLDLTYASAPAELVMVSQWFIPSNFWLCLSTIAAVKALRWAYEWNIRVINLKQI